MEGYTEATVLAAEGARVALVSCKTCGAVLLLDPRDSVNVLSLHTDWHSRFDAARKGEGE